jgi:thiol-disulfide isomerase/thioredoxin
MKTFFKKYFSLSRLLNFVIYGIVLFVLVQRAPSIFKMFQSQGTGAPVSFVKDLQGQSIQVPLPKKQVLVFWATWCGPCNIELGRINKLILKKEISADSIIAISSFEDPSYVSEFAIKHNYQFVIATDETGLAAKNYNVSATPTIIFIEKTGDINWMTMGLSPTLEFRLKSFLKEYGAFQKF